MTYHYVSFRIGTLLLNLFRFIETITFVKVFIVDNDSIISLLIYIG